MLTIPHNPSPRPPDAGRRSVPLRFHCHPEQDEGFIVPKASHPISIPRNGFPDDAHFGWIPVAEHQVMSCYIAVRLVMLQS